MSEEGFERFDKVVTLLKANNVYAQTELKQTVTTVQTYSDKWELNTTHKLTGTGSTKKAEDYTKVNQQTSKVDNLKDLSFIFKLKVGDKIPQYTKLFKVSDGTETSLTHKEGEVLLIDVWATWCGPCQKPMDHNQKMLSTNQAAWKDKARIVAVSVDEEIQTIRERIEKKKWNNIQHLTLLSWNHQHGLITNFSISGIPFVALINKAGVIDFIGHPSGINLEERINSLINDAQQASAPKQQDEQQQGSKAVNFLTVTPETFNKIQENLKTIEKEVTDVQGLTLTTNAVKFLKEGKEEVFYSQVTVDFAAKAEQAEVRRKILDLLSKDVPANAIQNKSYVDDPTAAFEENKELFQNLAKEYKLPAPQMVQEFKNVLFGNNNLINDKSLVFSPVVIGKDISLQEIIDLRKKINTFICNIPQEVYPINISKIINNNVPITLLNSPFFGIKNLQNTKTKQTVTLTSTPGRTDCIAFYWSAQASQKFIQTLIQKSKTVNKKIHINIFCKKQIFSELMKLQDANPELVTVYLGGPEVKEIDMLMIRSVKYLIVVDEKGDMIHAGQANLNEFAEIIKRKESEKEEEFVGGDPSEGIKGIVEGEEFKVLSEKVKEFDYQPTFNVSYKQNHQKSLFTKPKLNVAYRKSDESLFASVITTFSKFTDVNTTIFETVDIPEGKICVTCNSELTLPYYFYYFSNTFRCVACAEKTNSETKNLLQKFAVSQNGALILKPNTSVDKKRFGNNVQAKTTEQAVNPNFMCNGCGHGNPDASPRYICMGCRREPNHEGDYVDFCVGCATALRGQNEEKKKLALEASEKDGHKEWHPMLRVNFSPQGYYDY